MDIDEPLKKEEKDMSSIPNKVEVDRQSALNKISAKTPILDAQKGKIKLNPENPSHRDWYEDK